MSRASASEWSAHLSTLLSGEHHAMVEFLLALAEFDRERLWVELGHASLFSYLHHELGMSKASAYYRKTLAALIQEFPEIIEPLRDGRLCITVATELAKVLTRDNVHEQLPRFFHCGKREAKVLAVAAFPLAVTTRDVIAPKREAKRETVAESEMFRPAETSQITVVRPAEPGREIAPEAIREAPAESVVVEPMTPSLHRLHMTVSAEFLEKLEQAKAVLSHKHRAGRLEDILSEGLELILKDHAKRNGLTERPRKPREVETKTIPALVKREVWRRDGGRCQWPRQDGGICGSKHQIEFDHVRPRALEGPHTAENVRLLCRFHNQVAAEREFGPDFMSQFAHPS